MVKSGVARSSILELIGDTPLLELRRFCKGLDGLILLKMECLGPTFSKKDRVALQIVRDAREEGRLAPGQTVVELTSGNTGTALAMVCAVLGHPFVAVMSRGNSVERARMMRGLGAELVLVDQARGAQRGRVSGEDLALVDRETERIVAERGAFRADQFRNHSNLRAWQETATREIWEQVGGDLDAFCDFPGTGGSFGGLSRGLKSLDASIRCYVVEPAGAAALAGEGVCRPGHRIQGGGYAMENLQHLDKSLVDGYLTVEDEEAVETARELARSEGVFGGYSTGANCAAARRLLQSGAVAPGARVLALACDSGLKYMSTDLWPEAE